MHPELLWKPFDPTHIRNPYAMYTNLREQDPIHRSQTGEWIITRYADVKSILKSNSFKSGNRLEWLSRGIKYFKNQDEELSSIYAAINSFILFLNPPDHLAVRNLVSKTWQNREVDDMIIQKVKDLVQSLPSGELDAVRDFAQPLPVLVISEIMGIPPEDYKYLQALGVKMMRSLDLYHTYKELAELNLASRSFVAYFQRLIQVKNDHQDNGLISKLIQSNKKENLLREEQLISVCIFLFIAGEETTASSIGTGLFNLIRHPESYRFVQTHMDLLLPAIDELFRFDPPVQLLGRIAKTEVRLADTVIPEGAAVTLVLGSANRDPLQFDDPENLNLGREPNHHLAFGSGVHYCLGDWLGRLQTRYAIKGFLTRYKSVIIKEQDLCWNKNLSVRGLQSLRVVEK